MTQVPSLAKIPATVGTDNEGNNAYLIYKLASYWMRNECTILSSYQNAKTIVGSSAGSMAAYSGKGEGNMFFPIWQQLAH
jgi:hypothetical protein